MPSGFKSTEETSLNRVDTYFCPKCDSPHVEVPELEGAKAVCKECKFEGTRSDFPLYPIVTEAGVNLQSLMQRMVNRARPVLGEALSHGLIRLLVEFGFIPWDTQGMRRILWEDPEDRAVQQQIIGIYIVNAAKAVVRSIVLSRAEVESIRLAWDKRLQEREALRKEQNKVVAIFGGKGGPGAC